MKMYNDLFKTILDKKMSFLYKKTIEKLERDELKNMHRFQNYQYVFVMRKKI